MIRKTENRVLENWVKEWGYFLQSIKYSRQGKKMFVFAKDIFVILSAVRKNNIKTQDFESFFF